MRGGASSWRPWEALSPWRGPAALGCTMALCASAGAQIAVADRTSSAGLTMQFSPDPFMVPQFLEWTLGGMAVGDFNNDGWPDLFVLRGGGAADRLYINKQNGTFENQAAAWGVAATHAGAGVCAGDYDNDGWTDLYVTSFGSVPNDAGEVGKNRLYHNNGNGTFSEVAAAAGVNVTSATKAAGWGCAFGDYDLDGHLDLAVAAWDPIAQGTRLFHNNGDGTFTDVTTTATSIPAGVWGFQPSFADMDGDGYPELLISADFETSAYHRNNADGTFTNITATSGTGLDDNGMGQCVGDFNNDGRLDWFVTSIWKDVPNPGQYNGCTLYTADMPHHFFENALAAGVADAGWGWGAVAVDLDCDGYQDIVEVNGRAAAEWINEREYIFRNDGDGTFTEVGQAAGLTTASDGRCVVTMDYDRDGDMDIVLLCNAGPLKLWRNDSPGGKWLQLVLDTSQNPSLAPRGRGVRATAVTGPRSRLRYMDGGHSYLGSSEEIMHFGLGTDATVDTLTIVWPLGYVTTLTNVPANQRLTVVAPRPADFNADGVVNGADLGALLAHWGTLNSPADRLYDLNWNGAVDGGDLGQLLGTWGP